MRNGSGTYTLPSNTWNPAVPGVPILSDDWNQTAADLALAITQSIASDGQTPTTAPIPFALGVRVNNGSLSASAFAPTADTDTGVYFPAANQGALVAGGVAALSWTNAAVTINLPVTFTGGQTVNGDLEVTGDLQVDGDAIIGSASGDTLTVNATGTFAANQTFNGTATFTSTVTVPDASFTNAKLANMAQDRIKGRVSSGAGAPEDLTGTQATTILVPVVGDSGSGGTKGLVPAPASGDAAKALYLGAGGAFVNELKARGAFDGSNGATLSARNITCVRNGTGDFTFTLGAAQPSTNYEVFINESSNAYVGYPAKPEVIASTMTTTTFNVLFFNGSGVAYDPVKIYVNVSAAW